MKKLLTFVSFYLFAVLSFAQQIPNSDFEQWVNDNEPEVWNSGYDFGWFTVPSVERSSDAHSGNYAAKIYSQQYMSYLLPGYIMLGEIDFDNQKIIGGIPFEGRPTAFKVYLKFNPVDSDNYAIFGLLTKYNPETHSRDTIGGTGFFYISDSVETDYHELIFPFVYNDTTEMPDTLNFGFVVSIDTSGFSLLKAKSAGSELFIDDLQLLYGQVIMPTFALPPKNVSDSSFTAQWLPIQYAIGYQVDVATDQNFSNILPNYNSVFVDSTSLTVFPDTSLGNKFYYRVRVVFDTAISENSNTVAVELTFPTICLYPDDITQTSFTARWLSQPNADMYLLDVAHDRNFSIIVSNLKDFPVKDTFYLVSGLSPDDSIFYRVRVRYMYYNLSDYSNIIALKTANFNKVDDQNQIFIVQNGREIVIYGAELKNFNVQIFDILGKKYFSEKMKQNYIKINLPSDGIFIIKFFNNKTKFYRKIYVF